MDTDVLIVGAGLSGLVAAKTLEEQRVRVTVLDKGRSPGGRLATRRIQGGVADHGAQFFTVRTDEFQKQVDAWLHQNLVRVWGYGWSDGSVKRTAHDGHPRYITTGGMNNLAKHLARQLNDVRLNIHVIGINRTDGGFMVYDTDGSTFTSRALILTAPVPQSLSLLENVPLTARDWETLERIQYGPCLCGLFLVEGEIDLPDPGALQDFDQTVYWIADNQRKGISEQRVITTHAEARYSRQHYNSPDEVVLETLRAPVEARLQDGARIIEQQLKKWRYSIPLVTHPHDTFVASDMPLAFAGDAFGGRGRMEGAYLSGLAAGRALLERVPGRP